MTDDHERLTKADPDLGQIEAFLCGLHAATVSDLHALNGGFWSSAFGYRVDDRELVLHLGTVAEGFEMDRAAVSFSRPDLPVPEVFDIGEALGSTYAISARHHGRFLGTKGWLGAGTTWPARRRLTIGARRLSRRCGAPVTLGADAEERPGSA